MILVDTTVLAYAVGTDHALRSPCRRVFEAVADGSVVVATTVEVLQEFTHVRARRRHRDDAVGLTRSFADALTIIETTREDLEQGLDLFLRHEELGAFDAVFAGVAIRLDAEALISADRAFTVVGGLRHVDPATPDLGRLLRRRA